MARRNGHNVEKTKKVRYAVVGLGYIGQAAVLPAFANARENSELAALVSEDPVKLRTLSKRYRVPHVYTYAQYGECLSSGNIDAVYIALPNSMHRDYVVAASEAGIHSLCEKPLAVSERECEEMIAAAEENRVKLMTAYRLHLDEANLQTAAFANSGKIGEPRIFHSIFSQQVKPGNIRLSGPLGGGTFFDLGIYCVNAARYIFRSEPIEVVAASANNGEERFREIDEMTGAILRFPGDRLAIMTSSFGASDSGWYEILGTKGSACLDNAYEYAAPRTLSMTVGERTREKTFQVRDQFAPELVYFSDCILHDRKPEPSGQEGLADVRIIQAIYDSAGRSKPVPIEQIRKSARPTRAMTRRKPRVRKPRLIHASPPSP